MAAQTRSAAGALPPPGQPLLIEVDAAAHAMRLTGCLDSRSVPDVRIALLRLLDLSLERDQRARAPRAERAPTDLFIDLSGAFVRDATPVGLLIEAHRRARRANARIVLINPSERTVRLLRSARLQELLAAASAHPAGGTGSCRVAGRPSVEPVGDGVAQLAEPVSAVA